MEKCYLHSVVAETYDPTITFKAVKGKLFSDENSNGTKEAGERGIRDMQIEIVQGGVPIAEVFTDETGSYIFPDLQAGTYELRIPIFPDGLIPSPLGPDSHFDPGTQITPPFTFAPADTVPITLGGGFTLPPFYFEIEAQQVTLTNIDPLNPSKNRQH